MKKIFLDLGTHYGQGLKEFINMYKIDNTWEIHTFEANPITYDVFLKTNEDLISKLDIKHYNLAIHSKEEEIELNIETPFGGIATGMGTSIVSLEQWNPWNDSLRENFKNKIKIKSIRLSEFIKNKFSKQDFILIKMDIEGAEYEVLDDLEQEGALEFVDDLYVEMHSKFFNNKEEIQQKEKDIIYKIKQKNINFNLWH